MPDSTVLAKLLVPILEVARHQRLDPQQLLQSVGLSLDALNQPAARISAQCHNQLLALLAERLANPRIALRIGEATQPRMLGSVGFLMTTAQDLNGSFQLLADYLPILLEGAHLDYRETPSGRTLRLELNQSLPYTEEWLLACLYNWPRWLSGKQIPAVSVSLLQAEPAETQSWQQFFAAEVSFDAPANQIILPSRYLEYPCLDANEEMHQLHREFADTLLSHSSEESALIARIRSQIRLQLASGEGQVRREAIAALLNMSLRTMQRKLGTLNSSFQLLLDQTRKEATLQEIRKGKLSLGEIAYRMGFSNPSAFQKAFKRWQGMPPTEYRRQLKGVGEPVQPADKENSLETLSALSLSEFYPLALQLIANSAQWPTEAECTLPEMLRLRRHQEQFRIRREENPQNSSPDHYRYQPPEHDLSSLRVPGHSISARLFNLGALLFRLICGQAPYPQRDLGVLLNAKQQAAEFEFPSHLPVHLQQLLGKLLAAEPAERYHSQEALTADLMRSHQLWQQKNDPQQFPPTPDLPARLTLSCDRLWTSTYGQLSRILKSLRGFRHWGLCGGQGSGKTRFLAGLQARLSRENAIVLYADAARDPQLPLTEQLFQPLLCQMLCADAEKRSQWQTRLQQHLSRRQQLMQRLPELELLLQTGETRPALTRESTAALSQEQLLQSCRELLQACSDRPLVLMLDNCEKLSPFGQVLIHNLQTAPLSQPLLLISSTRHPDSSPASDLFWLEKLTPAQISELIQQSLAAPQGQDHPQQATDQPEAAALAALLSRQTNGSLAAISRMIAELQHQGALSYQPSRQRWQFLHGATEADSSDTALGELYSETIRQLHSISRQMLYIAAVLGRPFTLDQIATLMADPLARMEIHIWPLLQNNILIRSDPLQHYSFSHPQLARYIYQQIPPQIRNPLHLKIGQHQQAAQASGSAAEGEFTDYAYLNHLAQAADLLPATERQQLAGQCLQLTQTALEKGQAAQGLRLSEQGLTLLKRVPQAERFELERQQWQALWLLNRQDEADNQYRQLKRRYRQATQQQPLLLQRAGQLSASGELAAAFKLLNQALSLQGNAIPDDDTALRLQLADQWFKLQSGVHNSAPTDAPTTDQARLLELYSQVTEQLGYPLHQACAITRQGLPRQDQPRPLDAVIYASLSFVSSWLTEDLHAARQFAERALSLAEAMPDNALKARTLLICASRTCHWYGPVAQADRLLRRAQDIALGCRDWLQAGQALVTRTNVNLYAGAPLPTPEALQDNELEKLMQLQLPHQATRLKDSAVWLLDCLRDHPDATTALADSAPNSTPDSSDSWHMLARSCSALLLNQRSEWDRCLRFEGLLENQLAGQQAVPLMQLFTGLMRLDRLRSPHTRHHQVLKREISRQCARFELWAERNPANYGAMWQLLLAESRSLDAQPEQTIEHYEQALQSSDSLMLQAMICERYGNYAVACKRPAAGQLLLQQACHHYIHWGATKKARQLEQRLAPGRPIPER